MEDTFKLQNNVMQTAERIFREQRGKNTFLSNNSDDSDLCPQAL